MSTNPCNWGKLPRAHSISKSIRISDELLALAKVSAEKQHRSPPQQIEHWAAIGQVLEPILDWPMAQKTKEQHLDELFEFIESPEAKTQAKKFITKTIQTIVSVDDE